VKTIKEAIKTLQTEFEVKVGSSTRNILHMAEILAEGGVNLTTVSIEKFEGDAYIRLLTSDSEAAARVLMKADMAYTTRPVLVAEVEDRPGRWARIAKRLADAGLEIEASYLLSRDGQRMKFVFAVNDPKKGEEVLADIK
jgi:hypothetical protein